MGRGFSPDPHEFMAYVNKDVYEESDKLMRGTARGIWCFHKNLAALGEDAGGTGTVLKEV